MKYFYLIQNSIYNNDDLMIWELLHRIILQNENVTLIVLEKNIYFLYIFGDDCSVSSKKKSFTFFKSSGHEQREIEPFINAMIKQILDILKMYGFKVYLNIFTAI